MRWTGLAFMVVGSISVQLVVRDGLLCVVAAGIGMGVFLFGGLVYHEGRRQCKS